MLAALAQPEVVPSTSPGTGALASQLLNPLAKGIPGLPKPAGPPKTRAAIRRIKWRIRAKEEIVLGRGVPG